MNHVSWSSLLEAQLKYLLLLFLSSTLLRLSADLLQAPVWGHVTSGELGRGDVIVPGRGSHVGERLPTVTSDDSSVSSCTTDVATRPATTCTKLRHRDVSETNQP